MYAFEVLADALFEVFWDIVAMDEGFGLLAEIAGFFGGAAGGAAAAAVGGLGGGLGFALALLAVELGEVLVVLGGVLLLAFAVAVTGAGFEAALLGELLAEAEGLGLAAGELLGLAGAFPEGLHAVAGLVFGTELAEALTELAELGVEFFELAGVGFVGGVHVLKVLVGVVGGLFEVA